MHVFSSTRARGILKMCDLFRIKFPRDIFSQNVHHRQPLDGRFSWWLVDSVSFRGYHRAVLDNCVNTSRVRT